MSCRDENSGSPITFERLLSATLEGSFRRRSDSVWPLLCLLCLRGGLPRHDRYHHDIESCERPALIQRLNVDNTGKRQLPSNCL